MFNFILALSFFVTILYLLYNKHETHNLLTLVSYYKVKERKGLFYG
ncbi:hypothetical protein ANACAC_01754 [Anaerostipes caccae L1-92]|uniref:Uncharacterized protein n=1 Tax=Anaerostipes caccae (strain DSM 14662 / CCUG 47493 / JCM 13470 / NCIMB 13811 / L1-92) TaxID=411490 RepID=B0MDW2_ANACD|nr:hypothetical protein ANACAC_01754 [Anaerostipes caccae L1-92]